MRTKVPVLLAGALCFFLPLPGFADLRLATDLLAEADWTGCRREALRVLTTQPTNPAAQLLVAVAGVHSSNGVSESRALLNRLASQAGEPEVRAMAAYEAGRLAARSATWSCAVSNLTLAFQTAASRDLFLRAGCALQQILGRHPDLVVEDSTLAMQLQTVAPLWTPDIRAECALMAPNDSAGWLARPGIWIVAFYRSLVAPALGARCNLTPSCSEYFRQASLRHGLLGLPMIADRLVREPDVAQKQWQPLVAGDRIRCGDPVADHFPEAAK